MDVILSVVVLLAIVEVILVVSEIVSDHHPYILALMLLAWEHLSDIPSSIVIVLCFLFWNGRLKKRFNDIKGNLLEIRHGVSDVKIMQRAQMNRFKKEKQQGD